MTGTEGRISYRVEGWVDYVITLHWDVAFVSSLDDGKNTAADAPGPRVYLVSADVGGGGDPRPDGSVNYGFDYEAKPNASTNRLRKFLLSNGTEPSQGIRRLRDARDATGSARVLMGLF
jgi:hypothetical protein